MKHFGLAVTPAPRFASSKKAGTYPTQGPAKLSLSRWNTVDKAVLSSVGAKHCLARRLCEPAYCQCPQEVWLGSWQLGEFWMWRSLQSQTAAAVVFGSPWGREKGTPTWWQQHAESILEELSMRLDTKFPAQFRVPQTNPPSPLSKITQKGSPQSHVVGGETEARDSLGLS